MEPSEIKDAVYDHKEGFGAEYGTLIIICAVCFVLGVIISKWLL